MRSKPKPIGPLSSAAIESLLQLDVPAHLATIDPSGYPRITPIWFLWKDGAFYMTSFASKPHVRNLQLNPKATVRNDHFTQVHFTPKTNTGHHKHTQFTHTWPEISATQKPPASWENTPN